MGLPHFSTMAEIEASEFFTNDQQDETPDWHWCNKNATFSHNDACEFIIHCGDKEFAESKAERMLKGGCSKEFVSAYKLAAASGAVRVLFYV